MEVGSLRSICSYEVLKETMQQEKMPLYESNQNSYVHQFAEHF